MNKHRPNLQSVADKGVAIVIPVRNRPDLLSQCLSSLAIQGFPVLDCEILVCDDGSTVDLSETVRAFSSELPKIQLLQQRAKGPAAARNMGFRSSNAEVFVCLDSDVVCAVDFLSELLSGLSYNPHWVAAEATVVPVQDHVSPIWDAPVSNGGVFISAGCAYRAHALRRVGGFDETFPFAACEDTDLAARLLSIGKYGYVPTAKVYHPSRRVTLMTHWKWRMYWKYVMILAKRYGFLQFPGRPVGRFPRLRVSLSALICIPGRRLLESICYLPKRPSEALLGIVYALFDFICGLVAFPSIMFTHIPPMIDYLSVNKSNNTLPMYCVNPPMGKLSIIILNYNTADLVIQCLKSIYETVGTQILGEVIVVDNASTDGSISKISTAYPSAKLIQAPFNLGFAKGNNLGMQHASGDFLLLLNSDTIVCDNMIARLVEVLQNNPTVGAVGSRILNLDGTDQDYPTRFPSLAQMIIRMFVRRQIPWPIEPTKMPVRTERIMGACLMTRRDVLDQIGFLDETFFMYDEDVDWSIRCRKAGWELWLMPDVATIHLKGQTSLFRRLDTNSFNARMFLELRRSRYRLYRKHAGWVQTLMLKMCTDSYMISALAINTILAILTPSKRLELKDKLIAYLGSLCLNPFGE